MAGGDELAAVTSPLVGQVVQGRYRVDRLIGKGGMGVVYEAQHLLIRRKVALKVLSANAAFLPERAERFRREALAAAAVGSSHVVDVLDMGQLDSGVHYIVLEHLDGVDLGFAVAVAEQFAVGRAVHVLCQLCDALSAVHASGIVHRDLKPENVFLIARDGLPDFVKVLDFGICKFVDGLGTQLTETGDALGTPLFMAPEQVEGRRDVDHRADIYALGALLFFMLTGRAPFDAPSLPLLFVQICREPPPKLRALRKEVPSGLEAVVQRALSKRPEDRFASCAELKSALAPFMHVEALRDTLPSLAPAALASREPSATAALVRAHVPRRFNPRLALLGASAVLGGVVALTRLARAPEPAAPPLREQVSVEQGAVSKPPSAPVVLASQQEGSLLDDVPPGPPAVTASPTASSKPGLRSRGAAATDTLPDPAVNRAEGPLITSPEPAVTNEPRAEASSAVPAPSPPSTKADSQLEVPLNREPKRGL